MLGRVLARAALALLGLAVGVGLVEAGLRLKYDAKTFRTRFDRVPDNESRWVSHPFFPYLGRPGAVYTLHAAEWGVATEFRNNAYGYRTHDFPPAKAPGDYFVVALGGSTTEGALAETNAETWPELLEAMLAERYPGRRVRVFNLGVSGATAAFSVVSLALVGVHLDPDLVIVYHGFNDYGPIAAKSYRSDFAHHFIDVDPEQAWRGLRLALPVWLRTSYAVTYVTALVDHVLGVNRLGSHFSRDLGEPVGDVEAAVERLPAQLETIRSLAEGAGAEVLFSTFQFADGDDYTRVVLNRALRSYFQANQLMYVDQDRLIPDHDRSLQIDQCHLTADGRRLLAKNFFDYIVDEGLLED